MTSPDDRKMATGFAYPSSSHLSRKTTRAGISTGFLRGRAEPVAKASQGLFPQPFLIRNSVVKELVIYTK